MDKTKGRQIPEWVIALVWFLAAGVLAGFWVFYSVSNTSEIIGSAVVTAALAIIATGMQIHNNRIVRTTLDSPERLLRFVWDYPLRGKNEASWAIKESAALKGEIGRAREKPALGVAIVTTELGLIAFGKAADNRVKSCISWATANAEKSVPYRIQVEDVDPITDTTNPKRPDLRHTFAFGVILARARKQYSYLESYLKLAIEQQRPDGGWLAEAAGDTSPVFTAFYAVEMLYLAASNQSISNGVRAAIPNALAKGIKWLMENRQQNGLWSTGTLRQFSWDGVLATAWVLHRLAITAEVPVQGWRDCLDDALFALIVASEDSHTWRTKTDEAQQFRVEARIAAAVRRADCIGGLSKRAAEAADRYKGAWKAGVERWLRQLPIDEMDLATAAFLVWGFEPEKAFRKLGRTALRLRGATR